MSLQRCCFQISCDDTGDVLTLISGIVNMCTQDKDDLENNHTFQTNGNKFLYITANIEVCNILNKKYKKLCSI